MTLKAEFEKAFEKAWGNSFEPEMKHSAAKWGFIQGMRKAAKIAGKWSGYAKSEILEAVTEMEKP